MLKLSIGGILALCACTVQAQQLALLAPAQPAPTAGSVLYALGDTQALNSQGVARRLSQGDVVREGDTVVTGADSHLQLRMTDDALLALRPDSRLRLHIYSYVERGAPSSHASMELLVGGLRSITGAIGRFDKQNYIIRGGKALIGVRGTDHETFVVDAGTYNRVITGGTYLADERGRVDLEPNETGFSPREGGDSPRRLEATPEFMHAAFRSSASTFTAEMREDGLGDERRLQRGLKLGQARNADLAEPAARPGRPERAARGVLPAQTFGEQLGHYGQGHGKGGRCGGPCSGK